MEPDWRNGRMAAGRTLRCALALLLLVAAGWELRELGLGSRRLSSVSRALEMETPEFDGFSQPAVAAGILRQEAERLFQDYVEQHERESASSPTSSPARLVLQPVVAQVTTGGSRSRNSSPRMARAIQELEQLEATTSRLQRDLERKLLAVYSRNDYSNKVLDRYLELLSKPPDGEALVLAPQALEWSRSCGRSEELLDAIEHLCRFRPQSKDAAAMRAVLAAWAAQSSTQPDLAGH